MIVALHALWTPVTVVLFVLLARPGSNPLQRIAGALLTAVSTPGGRRVLLVTAITLVANFAECLLEPYLPELLGYDMTAWVRSVEGDLVERVQATLPAALTAPLGWYYLSGFIAAILAPVIIWTDEARFRGVRALAIGCIANYVFALAFYLFFPVREAAWSGLSDAAPLLDQVYSGMSADTRLGSALDNCFPSLHVSLTVTVLAVVIARRAAGDRALLILASVNALLTIYAVLALGVHWGLDAAVGVPFGVACARIGIAATRNEKAEPA